MPSSPKCPQCNLEMAHDQGMYWHCGGCGVGVIVGPNAELYEQVERLERHREHLAKLLDAENENNIAMRAEVERLRDQVDELTGALKAETCIRSELHDRYASLRDRHATLLRKVAHGCTDATCDECDT